MFDADGDDRIGLLDLEAAMAPRNEMGKNMWIVVRCLFFGRGTVDGRNPAPRDILFGKMIFLGVTTPEISCVWRAGIAWYASKHVEKR